MYIYIYIDVIWCTCRFFGLLSSQWTNSIALFGLWWSSPGDSRVFPGSSPTKTRWFSRFGSGDLFFGWTWFAEAGNHRHPCFTRSSWPPGRSSLWAELQTNIAFRLQSTRSSKNLISCWKHFLSTRCARRIDVETSFAPGEAWVHVVWCLFCSCIGGICLACMSTCF